MTQMTDRHLVVDVGWGWCGLRRTGTGLSRCTLPQDRNLALAAVSLDADEDAADELLVEVAAGLRRYFAGEAIEFGVELDLGGLGDFTQRVLMACREIPWGETRSYGELAAASGSPKAARAVGGALHRNPVAPVVPCHRIIGADGRLVGFGGGLEMKRRLLELEAAVS